MTHGVTLGTTLGATLGMTQITTLGTTLGTPMLGRVRGSDLDLGTVGRMMGTTEGNLPTVGTAVDMIMGDPLGALTGASIGQKNEASISQLGG
jgi:hypothetical protein